MIIKNRRNSWRVKILSPILFKLLGVALYGVALAISYGLYLLLINTINAGSNLEWGGLIVGGLLIWIVAPNAVVVIIILIILGTLIELH